MQPANMYISSRIRTFAVAIIAALKLFVAISSPAQIGPTGAPAKTISIPGVPNAGSVTSTLFRGAQPEGAGYAGLQKLGINVVVDFRPENGVANSERKAVESLGMRFVSLPWNAVALPTRDELLSFFTLLRDNPDKKVFIHCEYGRDRTGVMIALYRIAVDRWTPEQAIGEMKEFHYHSWIYPHLARYVRAFPATLAADPSLAITVLRPRPSPAAAQPSSIHVPPGN